MQHRAQLLILALAGVLVVRPARAQPAATADIRAIDGVGDVDRVRLAVAGAGARWRVAATLELQAMVLGLAAAGVADVGEPAAGGAGGELGARIVPWPAARVRPYASAHVGGLLFPGRPFLPGATWYEAILTFGAGAEAALGEGWAIGAHALVVHLSNGQGLGPHNPAYDGYGLALALAYAPATDARALATTESPPPPAEVDVVVEVEAGQVGDDHLVGARARPSVRVAPGVHAALDVEAGALAGEPFVEVGVDAIGRRARGAAIAHAGYRRYAGVDTAVMTAQAEVRTTRELVVVAMGHHERGGFVPTRWRAAAGLRLTPTSTVTIDLGVGFDRIGDDTVLGGDHMDPYVGVEWRTPWGVGDRRVAMFLERQVSTVDVIGIRWTTATPAARRLR